MILAVYIFQEAIISQFRFLGGGFSLFLIFSLIWAVLSLPEVAALIGFFAGVLMDISPSSSGPMGQWAIIMIAACYAISYFGAGNESLASNPLGVTILISIVVFFLEFTYVATSALLGVQSGVFSHIILTIVGITLWTLIVTPIFLPIFSRLHGLAFDKESSI